MRLFDQGRCVFGGVLGGAYGLRTPLLKKVIKLRCCSHAIECILEELNRCNLRE